MTLIVTGEEKVTTTRGGAAAGGDLFDPGRGNGTRLAAAYRLACSALRRTHCRKEVRSLAPSVAPRRRPRRHRRRLVPASRPASSAPTRALASLRRHTRRATPSEHGYEQPEHSVAMAAEGNSRVDLIRTLNKLQDTFSAIGGETVDLPQIVVVYAQRALPTCVPSSQC